MRGKCEVAGIAMRLRIPMNKKRFMAFVACAFALVAAFALVGCGGTSAQTAGSAAGSASAGSDDSADIKTLTVGFDQSYPSLWLCGR